MNDFNEVFKLHQKMKALMDSNRGVLTLHFFDSTSVTARVKHSHVSFSATSDPEAIVETFTDDPNRTVTYNLFYVQDVS